MSHLFNSLLWNAFPLYAHSLWVPQVYLLISSNSLFSLAFRSVFSLIVYMLALNHEFKFCSLVL